MAKKSEALKYVNSRIGYQHDEDGIYPGQCADWVIHVCKNILIGIFKVMLKILLMLKIEQLHQKEQSFTKHTRLSCPTIRYLRMGRWTIWPCFYWSRR